MTLTLSFHSSVIPILGVLVMVQVQQTNFCLKLQEVTYLRQNKVTMLQLKKYFKRSSNYIIVKHVLNGFASLLDEETYISLVLSRLENQKLRRHVLEVLISRKRLELGETLGKGECPLHQHAHVYVQYPTLCNNLIFPNLGHFGQVFCATLVSTDLENPKKVAVKTLQGGVFFIVIRSFLLQ